ncbi:MAG TPA: hypothetical protein VGY30_05770 [Solirubrobacteraceae bacterium]|nr:hypothetical protein [Solirubrobacteraceae bacterium]
MRATKLTIALCLAVAAVMAVVTLSEAPARVVRGVRANADVASTDGDFAACQREEVLPRDISAVRMSVAAGIGPPVRVRAYSGARLLTEGSRPPNWTAGSVTVPLKPLDRNVSNITLCVAVGPNSDPLYVYGVLTLPQQAAFSAQGQPLPGRIGVEYLAAGNGSWFSRALAVARHMGIGHALSGSWVALLVAVLTGAIAVLAVRLAWRELP